MKKRVKINRQPKIKAGLKQQGEKTSNCTQQREQKRNNCGLEKERIKETLAAESVMSAVQTPENEYDHFSISGSTLRNDSDISTREYSPELFDMGISK